MVTNNPIVYHRDFRHDLPLKELQKEDKVSSRCQKMAFAALPLLSLHKPLCGPLSLGLSCLRTITYGNRAMEHFEQGNHNEFLFEAVHASLNTAAVGLFFFNPILCFLSSSISDFILNSRSLMEHVQSNNIRGMSEALAFMALDTLFLASLCCGALETIVATAFLQIALDLYLSTQHFKKGDYFEGVCQTILAGGRFHQALPHLKALQTKWNSQPTLKLSEKKNRVTEQAQQNTPRKPNCEIGINPDSANPKENHQPAHVIRSKSLEELNGSGEIAQSLGKITKILDLHVDTNDNILGFPIYTSEGFQIISDLPSLIIENGVAKGISFGDHGWKSGHNLLLLSPLPSQKPNTVRIYNVDRQEEYFGRIIT
jgi:hypothetical protein